MRSTNAASLPAMCSARATAQSLAETTATHLMMSETLICSPCSSQIWLPPMLSARAEAVTVSSGESAPESMASAASRSVMIFVTDAGARRALSSLAYSTVPVTFSISTALGAFTSTAADAAVPSAASAGTDAVRSSASAIAANLFMPSLQAFLP